MPSFIRLRLRVNLRLNLAVVWALALLAAGLPLSADELPSGFHERVYRDQTGEHKYTVFLPAAYTADTQWPVILYLHGASARGSDNRLPIVDGLAPHIRTRANTFPFVVVFPQCEDQTVRHTEGWLAESPDAQRALKILDQVESDFSIDRRHEILTGPSMGAVGAWSIASATPSRWAGVVIISGMGDPAAASKLKNVPIWAFHGEKDLAIPIEGDQRMIDAVRAAGGRPYFTVLPGARHIIAHVVYSDDAVYAWMLNPKSEPQPEQIVRNSERKPTPAELGFDINTSFVPAVEIPQAAYLRLGQDAIDALTSALPEMLPRNALSGSVGSIQRTGRAVGMSFQMLIAGMNYRGQLEQLHVECRRDGWLVLNLGLRHLTMEIQQTQLNGRLVSATAGPMYVLIGQRRPVWLAIPLRPYVESGHIRFESGSPRFNIPSDDFKVTTPTVEAHGLPLIRREVSSRFREKLVDGAYERKPEIEQRVVSGVPALINQLEARLDKELAAPRTIGGWPMPALQPRFLLWANAVQVDESGLALILGMTVSRPGLNPPECAIQRIQGRPLEFEDIPKTAGLQFGLAGGVMEGITAAMIAAGATSSDLLDLNPIGFAPFKDARRVTAMIPDLARFGHRLQVRTLAQLIEPVSITSAQDKEKTLEAMAAWEHDSRLATTFAFGLPKVRLHVEIKTEPEQTKWLPCAEIDVTVRQRLQMGLRQPDFERRLVDMEAIGNADVTAAARFADGFEPRDTRIATDEITKTFTEGWRSGGQMQLMHEMEARDLVFGSARLRVADVKWLEPFSVKFYAPAYTRITNPTAEPIEYAIRVPLSDWGGPYRIQPGKSHEFRVPYPVIVRYRTQDGEFTQTVSPGSQYAMGPAPDGSSRPSLEADSRTGDGVAGSSTSGGWPRSSTSGPSRWR
jgi:poly(3-hydroxybutyrate) depolymerase